MKKDFLGKKENPYKIYSEPLLREQMIDLMSGTVVFMGGGAILLRRQIEKSGKVGNAIFVEDINANAKGYELLYRMEALNR